MRKCRRNIHGYLIQKLRPSSDHEATEDERYWVNAEGTALHNGSGKLYRGCCRLGQLALRGKFGVWEQVT
jgi:hypothetical protein